MFAQRISFLTIPLFALACSGSVTEEPSGDGDASTGDGDGDSAPGDGDSGDGDSGDGDTGLDVCPDFRNDVGDSVIVEFVNERSTPIYLGPEEEPCNPLPFFAVANSQEPLQQQSGDVCGTTCQDVIDFGGLACPAACFAPPIIELGPNASLQRP